MTDKLKDNRQWLISIALIIEMNAMQDFPLTREDIPRLREIADQLPLFAEPKKAAKARQFEGAVG